MWCKAIQLSSSQWNIRWQSHPVEGHFWVNSLEELTSTSTLSSSCNQTAKRHQDVAAVIKIPELLCGWSLAKQEHQLNIACKWERQCSSDWILSSFSYSSLVFCRFVEASSGKAHFLKAESEFCFCCCCFPLPILPKNCEEYEISFQLFWGDFSR